MATTNRVLLNGDSDDSTTVNPTITFVNKSVSFSSSAGDQNSARGPDAGTYWEIQTLRAVNGDSVSREIVFKLVDGDGTTHAVLTTNNGDRYTVAAGEEASWYGKVTVPELWTVRAYWYAMNSGKTCSWQYTALEYDWTP